MYGFESLRPRTSKIHHRDLICEFCHDPHVARNDMRGAAHRRAQRLLRHSRNLGPNQRFTLASKCVLSIFVGLLYCYFQRCCAGVIAWLCILGTLAVTAVFGYIYYKEYDDKKKEITEANSASNNNSVTIDTDNLESERDWAQFFCICFWTFAGIWFFVILCCYHKISLIIHVIKAAARFINNNICVLFVPLYQLLIGIVVFTIWSTGLVFVYTSGDITKNSSGYPWSDVSNEGFGLICFIFNCFAILWLMAFILMMQVFIIAAAACV